jgi:Restriction endonuclease S subunits
MALTKHKLGEFIERIDRQNSDLKYGIDDVRGVLNTKGFMKTRANLMGRSFEKFLIVKRGEFAFNRRTNRHGDRLCLGYNNTDDIYIVTEDYVSFSVSEDGKKHLLPDYLYIYFLRDEFDRWVRYSSWGSATEFFNWEEMCDVSIAIPSLPIQQKCVDVYNAMLANQRSYESGLEDLKLTCDAYIEQLRDTGPMREIGYYIEPIDDRNIGSKVTLAQGVNVDKVFMPAKRIANDIESTRIVKDGQFAYNKVMKAAGTKLPIALRKGETCFVSGSYQVFQVRKTSELIAEYLMLWLSRDEVQRYAGFISWGSTRDILQYETLCEIKLPVPDIKIQQYIVNIYTVYQLRREINEQLKAQIKDLCPILIKGSLSEASA